MHFYLMNIMKQFLKALHGQIAETCHISYFPSNLELTRLINYKTQ